MTKPNDGGPAFPRPPVFIGASKHKDWWFMQDGMSRRDWLAGLAMQAIISKYGITESHSDLIVWSIESYAFADALIAEGDKGGGE